MTKPRAPRNIGPRARAFWQAVTSEYEPDPDEKELLIEATRAVDECESLRSIVEREGVSVPGSKGQTRIHPALSALNATRQQLLRLLTRLDLFEAADAPESQATIQAREAAQARWRMQREKRNVA